MTRRQLGEAAGVHLIAVRQYETGHRVPTVETVRILARAVGVTPLALTDRADIEAVDLSLRDLRLRLGMTQQEAADAAGMGRTRYSSVERGEVENLSLRTIRLLADGLSVSTAEVRAACTSSRAGRAATSSMTTGVTDHLAEPDSA